MRWRHHPPVVRHGSDRFPEVPLGKRQIRMLGLVCVRLANMDAGMTRSQAESLALRVRAETAHLVEVESDDSRFIVNVRPAAGGEWTLYDDVDWVWLRERILSPD